MTIYGNGCQTCAKAEKCFAECTGWEEKESDREERQDREAELGDARRKEEL